MKKASISILLVLILTPLLSLFSALSESARISTQKSIYKGAMYLSAVSVFSEFASEIFKDYGIFVLSKPSASLPETFREYYDYNTDISLYAPTGFHVTVDNIEHIIDKDGLYFIKQAADYSRTHLSVEAINSLTDNFLNFNETLGDGQAVISTDKVSNPEGLNNIKDIISHSVYETLKKDCDEAESKVENDGEESNKETSVNTILEFLGNLLSKSLLSLIVPDTTTVSSLTIDNSLLPSIIAPMSDEAAKNAALPTAYQKKNLLTSISGYDKPLFVRYLTDKFICYSDTISNSNGFITILDLDKPLVYELEYILCGNNDDTTNLLGCVNEIISLRTVLNIASILSDSNKREQTATLAQTISGLTIPLGKPIIQYIIISLWATAESIIDTRCLLKGDSIPLLKAPNDWHLSLSSLTDLSSYKRTYPTSKKGLNYKEYISSILILKDDTSCAFRALDLIELNVKHKYCDDFNISTAICGASFNVINNCKNIFFLPFYKSRRSYFINDSIHYTY